MILRVRLISNRKRSSGLALTSILLSFLILGSLVFSSKSYVANFYDAYLKRDAVKQLLKTHKARSSSVPLQPLRELAVGSTDKRRAMQRESEKEKRMQGDAKVLSPISEDDFWSLESIWSNRLNFGWLFRRDEMAIEIVESSPIFYTQMPSGRIGMDASTGKLFEIDCGDAANMDLIVRTGLFAHSQDCSGGGGSELQMGRSLESEVD